MFNAFVQINNSRELNTNRLLACLLDVSVVQMTRTPTNKRNLYQNIPPKCMSTVSLMPTHFV